MHMKERSLQSLDLCPRYIWNFFENVQCICQLDYLKVRTFLKYKHFTTHLKSENFLCIKLYKIIFLALDGIKFKGKSDIDVHIVELNVNIEKKF